MEDRGSQEALAIEASRSRVLVLQGRQYLCWDMQRMDLRSLEIVFSAHGLFYHGAGSSQEKSIWSRLIIRSSGIRSRTCLRAG